jgi:hypothetical protein
LELSNPLLDSHPLITLVYSLPHSVNLRPSLSQLLHHRNWKSSIRLIRFPLLHSLILQFQHLPRGLSFLHIYSSAGLLLLTRKKLAKEAISRRKQQQKQSIITLLRSKVESSKLCHLPLRYEVLSESISIRLWACIS